MCPVVSDQPEVWQVTGMWPDMSTVLAALQVCPPCSATCDTTLRLQGTAAQATSTNLGSSLASHPSFPGAISPCLSYLGDWWALPVPLPVPLRDKVLPTDSPFSPRNPSGRPASAQVTTDYPRESLCWVCSTHLGLLTRSHHRKTLLRRKTRWYISSSFLFCFKPHWQRTTFLLFFSFPCNSKS